MGIKQKMGTRFEETYQEGNFTSLTQILTDKETGVQYLMHCPFGQSIGLTVLVDRDGKPLLYRG